MARASPFCIQLILSVALSAPLFAQAPTAPVFSVPAGNYTAPLTLKMSESGTATIYYTIDGTNPTTNSTIYDQSNPAGIVLGPGIPLENSNTFIPITINAIAVANNLQSPVTSAAYVVAPATSTTIITAAPLPLTLPANLQMTSEVSEIEGSTLGAAPVGTVGFSSDSTFLGNGILEIDSTSQAWKGPFPDLGSVIQNPIGITPTGAPGSGVLVSADATSGVVGLYKLSASGTLMTPYYYKNNSSFPQADAIASGYFLQPKSSSNQSFVLHENKASEYFVFDGSTTGNVLSPPTNYSNSACDCSFDSETLTVDDFDNDGYSDLGVLIASYTDATTSAYVAPAAGIVLNLGASNPGTFTDFIQAPPPSAVVPPTLFCPIAITTGHFTSSAGAQLAVLATTSSATTCQSSNGDPTIYLYGLNTAGTALVQVGKPLVLPDANATTLASADFNQDGNADLVIGETALSPVAVVKPRSPFEARNVDATATQLNKNAKGDPQPVLLPQTPGLGVGGAAGRPGFSKPKPAMVNPEATSTTPGLRTAFGNGDGSFKTPSALFPTPSAPVAYAINDFNHDGYPDVAFSVANDGNGNYMYLFYNDGTGAFPTESAYFYFFSHPPYAPGGIAAVDLNGDGLADLVAVPGSASYPSFSVDFALNSASTRATFTTANQTIPAGMHTLTATYYGDRDFATSTSTGLSAVVIQTTPTIRWPGAGAIVYGTPLSSAQLNATASVAGAFSYNPGAGAILPAGTDPVTATFAPTDSFDYAPATATLSIVVTKAMPAITWAGSGASIVYGTPLSSAQLNATANVPGTFTYNTGAGTVLTAGTHTITATFTPTDIADYTIATATLSIVVTKALPAVTWTGSGSSIVYGTPLGNAQLNATSSVPGTFSYNPAAGAILPAGTDTVTATFTPTDSTDYSTATATLSIVVTKASPAITWVAGSGSSIVYGTPLSSAQLNATCNVPGTFTYNPAAGAILPVGTDTVAATFTPTDSADYTTATATLSIVVTKATPAITWPGSGSTLEYGTPLSSSELNATASASGVNVPGTFVYNPGLGAILPAGTDKVTVTFTPTDSKDYTTSTATLSIQVGSPSLTGGGVSPSSVNAGSANTTITVTGIGFVSGAVINYNGTALSPTTYIDQHHLSAVIPSTSLANPGTGAITVVDPGNLAAAGSLAFSVIAAPAVATVSATETTVTVGQQSTINLTLNPYPLSVTATATLTFTPAPPITVQDPNVLFSNKQTTTEVTINPSNAAVVTPFTFQSGSTAGTITITIHLTLAGGQDITPANITPITVTVPASPPVLQSPTLTGSGKSLQITAVVLSSTRDMTEAQFHFTAAPGRSLKTADITVPLTAVFQTWYGSTTSDQFGTSCTYTQPFTLDGDAADVGSVTITLVNSNGASEPATVQPTTGP